MKGKRTLATGKDGGRDSSSFACIRWKIIQHMIMQMEGTEVVRERLSMQEREEIMTGISCQ